VSLPRLPSPLVPPQVPLCRCYPLICALDVPMAVPRRRKSPPVYGPRAGTCPARQSSVRARIGRLGTGEPLPPRRAQSPPRHRLCEALRFRLLAQHVWDCEPSWHGTKVPFYEMHVSLLPVSQPSQLKVFYSTQYHLTVVRWYYWFFQFFTMGKMVIYSMYIVSKKIPYCQGYIKRLNFIYYNNIILYISDNTHVLLIPPIPH
jgi:hypothetical protein